MQKYKKLFSQLENIQKLNLSALYFLQDIIIASVSQIYDLVFHHKP